MLSQCHVSLWIVFWHLLRTNGYLWDHLKHWDASSAHHEYPKFDFGIAKSLLDDHEYTRGFPDVVPG